MEQKELTMSEPVNTLSVRLTQGSLSELGDQRNMLKRFISNQLTVDIDYGIIPGCQKPSLYKPGAEKIANIFQLGSRIAKSEKTLDIKQNFAMFAVTVEIYHLPSGRSIAQCEGIANSQEVKYRERNIYEWNKETRKKESIGKEETPVADVLNTLSKMAQKRAYVGAVIIATGASDFFTMDLDETDDVREDKPKVSVSSAPSVPKPTGDLGKYTIKMGKNKGKTLEEAGPESVRGLRDYLVDDERKTGKPLGGSAREFVETANAWLA
jgi:hypothetical protein